MAPIMPTMNAATDPASPAAQGYRMPAEWAPHQATWLSWPHKRDSWPGVFDEVPPLMAQAVAALSRSEMVRINVLDAAHESTVSDLLAAAGAVRDRVVFHRFPTNDAWCRDHGAIFVLRAGADAPLAALDFGFNAWGGKYPPWALDDAIPPQMADALGVPVYPGGMVLEGGSIEVNGAGALLTTEQCLLHPNRNPGLDRATIEARLRETLGVEQILWLGEGIAGDDTDGHIDDIVRFVAEDTVVAAVERDPRDDNYGPLQRNLERLHGMRLAEGRPLRVVELPMPRPVIHVDGERLPASYANFYIANRVVLVPVFNDPADAEALAVLTRCFPDRELVPIDCRRLVAGLGAFHCLTQQVPAIG